MRIEERRATDQGSGIRGVAPLPTPSPQPPTPDSQSAILPLRGAASPQSAFLRPVGVALGSFLATRVVVGLAAWLGVTQLIAANPSYNKGPFTEGALLWDAAWYMSIV